MLVEGVSYNVNWRAFKRGYSIFIPCLDGIKAKREVAKSLRAHKIKVLVKVAIEDGIKGLRIWRV
jgi:hypothetical protein